MSASHFFLRDEFRSGLQQYAEPKTFSAGTTLFHRGDPMDGVYLLRTGTVALSLTNVQGMKRRIVGPGALLGLPSTIGLRPYSLTAEALEKVEADFISREQFMALLVQYADLCLAVLKGLAREIVEVRDEEFFLIEQQFGQRAG